MSALAFTETVERGQVLVRNVWLSVRASTSPLKTRRIFYEPGGGSGQELLLIR
jgi:hypothetical protein